MIPSNSRWAFPSGLESIVTLFNVKRLVDGKELSPKLIEGRERRRKKKNILDPAPSFSFVPPDGNPEHNYF